MIPKIIHYCWFGNNEKSDKIKFCMETWKKVLPDYEFREWSEKDLEKLEDCVYVKQAYDAKKYAFVSDVFRLYALYTEGGIYLDTDVEVRKSFNNFLDLDFFIGAEKNGNFKSIGTAVIGSSPNNKIIKKMLSLYDNLEFFKSNETYNMLPNTVRLACVLKEIGNISDVYTCDNNIKIDAKSTIFPDYYFCIDSPNSYAVHHFEASWVDDFKYKNKLTIRLNDRVTLILRKYKQQRKNTICKFKENEIVLWHLGNKNKFWCLLKVVKKSKQKLNSIYTIEKSHYYNTMKEGLDKENINLSVRYCPFSCEWLKNDWRQKCIKTNKQAECMKELTPDIVLDKINMEY